MCFANGAGSEINSHILAIKTLKFITFKQLYLPIVVFRQNRTPLVTPIILYFFTSTVDVLPNLYERV